jgi:hypothetical protein
VRRYLHGDPDELRREFLARLLSIEGLTPKEIDELSWDEFMLTIGHCEAVTEIRNKVGGW